ncbi:hypothetical protein, partial [Escherichia coli]|uniref:hypothetical protein n=1 Tax=Escherichia coli TaxID=562 RepID=UPI001A7E138D
ADRNRSHWSTSKTPSYTKSVSWQHHHRTDDFILSKKTAKERLNMQLLRSNNWENYYTSF